MYVRKFFCLQNKQNTVALQYINMPICMYLYVYWNDIHFYSSEMVCLLPFYSATPISGYDQLLRHFWSNSVSIGLRLLVVSQCAAMRAHGFFDDQSYHFDLAYWSGPFYVKDVPWLKTSIKFWRKYWWKRRTKTAGILLARYPYFTKFRQEKC